MGSVRRHIRNALFNPPLTPRSLFTRLQRYRNRRRRSTCSPLSTKGTAPQVLRVPSFWAVAPGEELFPADMT
jgi:hypothetical protein